MNNPMAVLVMGSESDLEDAVKLEGSLTDFHVPVRRHILSAHRNTGDVLGLVVHYDACNSPVIYLACAGKKPDLGPVIAGNTDNPVVAYVKRTDPESLYTHHLLSALDTPPGVSLAVFSDPVNAALYAAKIMGLHDEGIRSAIGSYRSKKASANTAANQKYMETPLADLKAKFAKKPG